MVMIKDKITGKIQEFYAQWFKKGVLMSDTRNKKIEEALNKNLWDCPQCGKHSMEEPGLLCFHCNFMMSGEILEDYMTDEDGRREE